MSQPELYPFLYSTEVVFGAFPQLDDITNTICDRIYYHVFHNSRVNEIEVKIGKLRDTHLGEKPRLPIYSEAILHKDYYRSMFQANVAFDAEIEKESFDAMREVLNFQLELVQSTKGYKGPQVKYLHYIEDDLIFPRGCIGEVDGSIKHTQQAVLGDQVRLTLQNGVIKRKMQKKRIEDLEVLSPQTIHDFRLSINTETEVEINSNIIGNPTSIRNKDRRSYTYGVFTIDLTQVTEYNIISSNDSAQNIGKRTINLYDRQFHLQESKIKYELEMEINCEALRMYINRLNENPKSQSFSTTIKDALAFARACIGICGKAIQDPSYVTHLSQRREDHRRKQASKTVQPTIPPGDDSKKRPSENPDSVDLRPSKRPRNENEV